jgi:5-methylcytosine-specific restriction endonuclease McrA
LGRDLRPVPVDGQLVDVNVPFQTRQGDAFRCRYCGATASDGVKLHIDHIVPVVAGGETSIDNLVAACEQCNLGKAAHDVV